MKSREVKQLIVTITIEPIDANRVRISDDEGELDPVEMAASDHDAIDSELQDRSYYYRHECNPDPRGTGEFHPRYAVTFEDKRACDVCGGIAEGNTCCDSWNGEMHE